MTAADSRNGSGFSLIELLIVVSVLALIGGGIAKTFFSSMQLWKRAQTNDSLVAENVLVLNALGTQLRQTVNVPEWGLQGTGAEIMFVAPRGSVLECIGYEYDQVSFRLLRRRAPLPDVLTQEDPARIKWQERQLSVLDDCEFSFMIKNKPDDPPEWREQWQPFSETGEDGTCLAVRIRAVVAGIVLTRTVFLPESAGSDQTASFPVFEQ